MFKEWMLNETLLEKDIDDWLDEDLYYGDVSTSFIQHKQIQARIISRQNGRISGIPIIECIFKRFNINIRRRIVEGSKISPNDDIIVIEGDVRDILAIERTVLNVLTHLSGITTYVANLVEKVKSAGHKTIIAGTRKTLPGLRKYQKYAITIGGGDTHRMSLSSMILLKENHLSQFPSIAQAVNKARNNSSFTIKIEVEVRNEGEAIEAAMAGADIVMLDNFNPEQLSSIIQNLKEINPDVFIEVSGNITEDNLLEYVQSGMDIISLGRITHSVKSFDMSLLFDDAIN